MIKRLKRAERGLLILGALKTRAQQEQAFLLMTNLGWKTIADVTSGLRFLKHPLLDHSRDFSSLESDCVLQVGGRLISKALNTWLSARRGQTHLYWDPYALRENPNGSITEWFPEMPLIAGTVKLPPFEKGMTGGICVPTIISRTDWRQYALFLGNSLPIRDMDTYAEAGEHIPLVAANRGASGIDGIVSTACGFALGAQKPVILYLGDMTFLHDINGLAFIKQLPMQMIIIVNNNRGNGIFSTLPIAQEKAVFERYFLTPHEYSLKGACDIYGVRYQQVASVSEFESHYQEALSSTESLVFDFAGIAGFKSAY